MADWDLVIIGGGAAGLSAAAAAAESGLSSLLIDRMGGGGELMNLGALEDMDEDLSGPDLFARLMEAAATTESAITEVTCLARDADRWLIETEEGPHHATAVILAVGLAPGTLGLPNEASFEGMGLSHCAACDGPLFRGQPVVVAGADRWALAEAKELREAGCVVTLVSGGVTVPDIDGVTVVTGRIVSLDGANGLESITVRLDEGGAPVTMPAQGVFVQCGRVTALDFVRDPLRRDADGRVMVDDERRTDLPGLFVAGDARSGSPRTLRAAMADGQAAARAVARALGRT
jgi:thioredoxin reductase (NADPH)